MTTNRKNELIAQLVNILSELIEANDSEQVSEVKSEAVEMLTVKEDYVKRFPKIIEGKNAQTSN